jgi:hypothetical protein
LRVDAKTERMPIFLIFVCCDYLINTDSYVHVGVCVGNRSHRHDTDSRKIGRHNRMSPMCRDDISDMSATDKCVCRLRGVADRHICRHCQPSEKVDWFTPSGSDYIKNHFIYNGRKQKCVLYIIGVVLYNRGRIMYKKGGNQKKVAKFGIFLYCLYKKYPNIQDPIIIRISDKMRNRSIPCSLGSEV